MAVAETTVPYFGEPALVDTSEVVFSPDSTVFHQDIHIPGVASIWDLEAIYLWGADARNFRVYVPYGRAGERTEDGGWALRLNISDDQAAVRQDIERTVSLGQLESGSSARVHSMGVRFRVLDENWDPPNGVFDPEALAQPGTFSNVSNGNGFFGSIGAYQQLWNVEHMSARLGFVF